MDYAWTKTKDEVLSHFDVDEFGLTQSQVLKNQERYGANGQLISYRLFLFLRENTS